MGHAMERNQSPFRSKGIQAEERRQVMLSSTKADYLVFHEEQAAMEEKEKGASKSSLSAWRTLKNNLEIKSWHHPNSSFRRRWENWRCIGLIYFAMEVLAMDRSSSQWKLW
jgi:hypothetical protein